MNSIKTLLRIILLLAWCSLPGMLMAQPADSLELQLQDKSLTNAERIKLYDDLGWAYMNANPQRSVAHSTRGLRLALQTGDKLMEATFYRNMGVAYHMEGVYDSATTYLANALTTARQNGYHRLEAVIAAAYGNLYRTQGLYKESLAEYLTAAAYFEQENDLLQLGKLYGNIGGIYQLMVNYDQALPYFEKAAKLAEQAGDYDALAGVYVSLSDINLYRGEPKAKSLHYAQEAIGLYRQTGNRFAENVALQTAAKVHDHHNDHAEALPIAEKALLEAQQLGFPALVAQSLVILSNVYLHLERYDQCIESALQVMAQDSTDTNIMRNVYANLIRANAHLGRPGLTDYYLERYRTLLDTYATNDYQQALSAMEVKYETEKKELRIQTLETQHRLYGSLGIAGAIVLLIATAFAVVRYRLAVSRRKLAEEAAARLEQEKQLVATQAALDSEAAERSRLARDLHDGLGSMLSVVKLNLPQLQGGTVVGAIDVSRFQKALGMLDSSIRELRRVAHHMMPESLVRYGLKASLTDFCEAIPGVDFHYFGTENRLQQQLETLVYRCIHELVNNAVKHAKATHINVQLIQEAGRLSFTVQDDGTGFDEQTVTEGMGLRNIRQRIAAFRGKMSIYSSEQGTEVHVEFEPETNE